MLRRKGLSLAAIGAVLGAAMLAAPMPASAGETIKWSGAYIGAHAGYGWADWNGPLFYDDAATTPIEIASGYIGPFDGGSKSLNGDNWLGGLQVGANYQSGAWVVGLEADISWTDQRASGSFLPYPDCEIGCPAWAIKSKLDLFGTVRGRLGLARGPVLVYATGGLAWANVTSSIEPMYVTGSNGHATTDETHVGYTVGGGLEWMLARNWSLKAEYLFVDLGEQDYAYVGETTAGAPYDTDHHHADLTLHTVRVGVNYQFSN